jgi:hypothetical protein
MLSLFGFLATYGLLRLLHQASQRDLNFRPQLYFDQDDYCAVLQGVPSAEFLAKAVCKQLLTLRHRLTTDLASLARLERPGDLT